MGTHEAIRRAHIMAGLKRPMRPRPPMDPDGPDVVMPPRRALQAELIYATAEMRYATRKHRAAWTKMRLLSDELASRGIEYLDDNFEYKVAVGDVRWWREEQTAAATTVQALTGLINELRTTERRPG